MTDRLLSPLRALVLLVVGAACDNPAPVIMDAAIVSDTSVEAGPYEARVTAVDDDGIGASSLAWSTSNGAAGTAKLLVVKDATLELGTRLTGLIPGQPLGTEVRWHVDVCDASERCTQDPAAGRAFTFVVGIIPSSPVVAGVDPDHGPSSGGTRVEIRGADLRPGATVLFGDVPAAHVEWLRTDLIAAITAPLPLNRGLPIPPEGVAVDVRVQNPDAHAAVLPNAFTFLPSPLVTAVAPTSGPEAGGTAVAIHGGNFVEGVRAFFDGVPCRHQRRVDDAELDCDTPPGRGVVDVEVRDLEGGVGRIPSGFTYIPAPQIDVVDPAEGSSDGGDTVTVRGGGFVDGAVVTIGGAPCVDVVVASPDELTCTTPGGDPGAADVVVVNPDGQTCVLPGGFGFVGPPIVVEVQPGLVPIAGGVEVRVLGAGLDASDAVTFGGVAGTVTGAVGDSELHVTVPPVPAATSPAPPSGLLAVNVVVTRTQPRDTRSGSLAGGLVYFWPPEITSVIPPQGPTSGGTAVVVVGRFFRAIAGEAFVVRFDGAECASPTVTSSTALSCVTPPGDPGFADVEVENHPLSKGLGPRAYFYVAPPRVDSVDPPEGPTFGGDLVTVHGDFFQQGALVFIDGAPCTDVAFVSAQALTCVTPPGVEGPADVRVLNVDGQEDTAVGIYRYLGVAVTPDHGLPVGFTRVSVRSAGMQPTAVIRFGDQVASCTFVSSREFICQTPPHARGAVDVRFLNPDGTSETGHGAFEYRVLVAEPATLPSGDENANDVDVADLDGDGDLDLVVASGRVGIAETSTVWENDGAGNFTRHDLDVFTSANNVSIADADGDGRPDLLFGCSGGTGPVLERNTGGLAFQQVNLGLDGNDDAFDAELIDVVGDGRADIYNLSIGCDPNGPNACDPVATGPDRLFEQRNNGFTDRSSLVPHDPRWVHDHKLIAADLDQDGDDDVVIVTNNSSFPTAQNRVMKNRVSEGLGFVIETPSALLNLVGDLYDLEAGDIDGDGDPDIVTTICDGDFGEALLRNDAGALVLADDQLPGLTSSCTVGALLFDVDGDGDLDLMFGGTVSLQDTHTHLRLLVNRGDGTFVDGSDALPGFGNRHLQIDNFAAGDVDGDGDIDVVIAGGAPYFESDRPGRVLVLRLE